MARNNRRGNSKPAHAHQSPITFADHTVGTRSALQDEDGWTTVETKETKKNQRLRKFLNNHLPTPPPLPSPPENLNYFHVRADRHQFIPALSFARINARDPIFSAASRCLRMHNTSSFQHCVNPISIFTLERPSWHDFVLGPGTRHYAIGREGRDQFIAKVPLFISNHRAMVRDGEGSLDFQDWITTLPYTLGPDILGEAGYKIMSQWHKARGAQKKCKTLDADVMDLILLHAIGEVRNVDYFNRSPHITCEYDFRHESPQNARAWRGGAHILPRAIGKPDGRLFCVSKAIRERAQQLLRFHTIKSFAASITLDTVLTYAPASFVDSLTRVQLSFTDLEYYKFFRVALPGCILPPAPANDDSHADILQKIPNLIYLELFFHSPVDQIRSHQLPWDLSHLPIAHMRAGVITREVPYQCRRAMVDYIMCFAHRYVSQILKVNISGYVKTTTRDYWLDILQDKRNLVAHTEMVAERIKSIKKQSFTDFPPVCTCKLPCFYDAFKQGLRPLWTHHNTTVRERLQRGADKCHAEALRKYQFDYDDDMDTSEMSEEVLAVRHYLA